MPTKNWTPERLEHRRQQMAEHNKKYYAEHKEYFKRKWKEWCADNPERRRDQKRKETLKHLDESIAKIKAWQLENKGYYDEANRKKSILRYWQNPEVRRVYSRVNSRRLKEQIIAAYDGKCECCNATEFEFLSIDHTDGLGGIHRRELGIEGNRIYAWLLSMGCPKDGFRLLCMNCNFSRGAYGYCPHEKNLGLKLPVNKLA